MTITANSSLETITNSYEPYQTSEDEDALGRDVFLTMLVAQFQNQDPLNPMDGTDFSAQLAQFSQLEQLIGLNEAMDGLSGVLGNDSQDNVLDYIGKTVVGDVDVMNIDRGTISRGTYFLY